LVSLAVLSVQTNLLIVVVERFPLCSSPSEFFFAPVTWRSLSAQAVGVKWTGKPVSDLAPPNPLNGWLCWCHHIFPFTPRPKLTVFFFSRRKAFFGVSTVLFPSPSVLNCFFFLTPRGLLRSQGTCRFSLFLLQPKIPLPFEHKNFLENPNGRLFSNFFLLPPVVLRFIGFDPLRKHI